MKRNIKILYVMALLQGMVFYGPIATLYRQIHGISVFQITLIEGISLALSLLLEIPWGILADRIGYKKTIIFCSWLYFISKLVFWRADDFFGFLLERVMLGIVLAGLSGVDTSILYLSAQGRDMQRIYGRYHALEMLGLLLASATFSVFIRDNYALAGLLTAVSYGLAALLSLGIEEVKRTEPEETKRQPFAEIFRDVFHDRTLLLFLIAVALLSETHQTVTVFLNQLKYEGCGMEHSAIGIVYGVATLLGLLSACSAAVTKRLGEMPSMLLFCLLPVGACLLLGLTDRAFPSVLGVYTLRISNTLFQPFQENIRNRQVSTQDRATVLSIQSMLISCIAIGTNLAFGALSDRSLPFAFFFGSGICGVSLVLFVLCYKKVAKTHQ